MGCHNFKNNNILKNLSDLDPEAEDFYLHAVDTGLDRCHLSTTILGVWFECYTPQYRQALFQRILLENREEFSVFKYDFGLEQYMQDVEFIENALNILCSHQVFEYVNFANLTEYFKELRDNADIAVKLTASWYHMLWDSNNNRCNSKLDDGPTNSLSEFETWLCKTLAVKYVVNYERCECKTYSTLKAKLVELGLDHMYDDYLIKYNHGFDVLTKYFS